MTPSPLIVDTRKGFKPRPWRVSVSNMGVNTHSPVFVSINIFQTEPLDEKRSEMLENDQNVPYQSTESVFIAYRNDKGTLVSTLDDPLVYLTPESIIDRILDMSDTYYAPPLQKEDSKGKQHLYSVYAGHHTRLARGYWDDTLNDEDCQNLFRVVGYINRQGEPSIVPRSIFKQVMVRDLSAILMAGLPFRDDVSHSLFTIQFQRYFAE